MGTVKEVDFGSLGDCKGKCVRVRVMVNVSKPLKRGLRVKFSEEDEVSPIVLRNEQLPNFCYFCGRLGHLLRECPENSDWVVEGPSLKYGGWMRAAPLIRARSKEGGNSHCDGEKETTEERLDRFLCDMSWRESFPEAHVLHLNHEGLDYLPISVDKICRGNESGSGCRGWSSRFHFEEA
ncbi:hypothetical protein ACOSP7_026389 [Xanthoceras sorbifolium]